MKFTLVAILFALLISVYGKPQKPTEDVYGELRDEDAQDESIDPIYDDDTADEDDDEDPPADEKPPKILSPPQNVIVDRGQNITLYCNVTVTSLLPVILWKKDGILIYQVSTKLGKNLLNTKVENGGQSFQIFNANEENNGDYQCSILLSDDQGVVLDHTVRIKEDPIIHSLTSETNQTVYNVGDTMHLFCNATGFPTPIISWHMNKEKLGVTGPHLTVDSMKLSDAGYFRCFADNNSDKPAHEAITVHVNHKPIVTVEKFDVNTEENLDIELKCKFNGYPAPMVLWQKDGKNIVNVGNYHLKKEPHHLTLTIKNVSERDFGVYTCSAKNAFGRTEKSRKVVKTPAVLHMDSKKTGKDFKITIKVQSKSEVSKHDLQYRKKGESNWNNVSPQVMEPDSDNTYTTEYLLKNLEAGLYETRARSQNRHGWSEFSDIHEFSAKHHNNKHKNKLHKEKEVKVHEIAPPVYEHDTNQKEVLPKAHETNTPAQHQETMQKETPIGASVSGASTIAISSFFLISITLLSSLW